MPTETTSESEPSRADHRPALDKDGFDCPRCGHFAHQEWDTAEAGDQEFIRRGGNSGSWVSPWRFATCARCKKSSLWRDGRMVFPLAQLGDPPHADMPSEVGELYVEAARVAAVSRRAGAALARATVEQLIKLLDPDAPKSLKLDKRIDRLRPRVSSSLADMLDVVRYLGNKMLHAEDPDKLGELVVIALDDTEGPALVELLLETINDLVDELITKPKTVASVRDRLPEALRQKLAGGAAGAEPSGD